MKENENGMTLVEVLGTLVIASLFMGIIWVIFTISIDYNTVETKKMRLQQEANYIITELQRIHRQCDYYEFTLLEDKIVTNGCTNSEGDSLSSMNKTISSGYLYTPVGEYEDYKIIPKKDDLILKEVEKEIVENFSIRDPKNENLIVEIPTVISRYKDID